MPFSPEELEELRALLRSGAGRLGSSLEPLSPRSNEEAGQLALVLHKNGLRKARECAERLVREDLGWEFLVQVVASEQEPTVFQLLEGLVPRGAAAKIHAAAVEEIDFERSLVAQGHYSDARKQQSRAAMEAWEDTINFHEEEPERPPSRNTVRFGVSDGEAVFPDGNYVDRDEEELRKEVDELRETRSREGPRARFADPTPIKGAPMSSAIVFDDDDDEDSMSASYDGAACTLQARYRGHQERAHPTPRPLEAKMATKLQASERGRQGRIMVGKSARKPRSREEPAVLADGADALIETAMRPLSPETDDDDISGIVEQRVDELVEKHRVSFDDPQVPATPPRSPLRQQAALLSPAVEQVVVEAEAMEAEASAKEELAAKLKVNLEELARRAAEGEELRALSSSRRHVAEDQLEELRGETIELEKELAARRERRRSLQAQSP